MDILIKIAALLVAVTGTFASEFLCAYSKEELNCMERGLTAPPAGLWPNLTSLILDENPITTFAKNAFTGFPGLVYLFAQRTKLVEIDLGDFVEMPKLNALYFKNNNIKTIITAPEGTIFENLQRVDLTGNAIITLDPDFLFNAPNLEDLFMESNPIIMKPGQPIFNHNSVQSLYFGNGSNFADWDIAALLAGVPNIMYVGISNAHINNISGAFVNHEKLVVADLSENDITQITTEAFASEGELRKLSLLGNPLNQLEMATVTKAMKRKGWIDVTDTPLACNCLYEGLYWWAEARDITISAECGGENLCGYTRRRSPASPAQN